MAGISPPRAVVHTEAGEGGGLGCRGLGFRGYVGLQEEQLSLNVPGLFLLVVVPPPKSPERSWTLYSLVKGEIKATMHICNIILSLPE